MRSCHTHPYPAMERNGKDTVQCSMGPFWKQLMPTAPMRQSGCSIRRCNSIQSGEDRKRWKMAWWLAGGHDLTCLGTVTYIRILTFACLSISIILSLACLARLSMAILFYWWARELRTSPGMLCETMRDEARSAKFESESEQTWTWDQDIDQNWQNWQIDSQTVCHSFRHKSLYNYDLPLNPHTQILTLTASPLVGWGLNYGCSNKLNKSNCLSVCQFASWLGWLSCCLFSHVLFPCLTLLFYYIASFTFLWYFPSSKPFSAFLFFLLIRLCSSSVDNIS